MLNVTRNTVLGTIKTYISPLRRAATNVDDGGMVRYKYIVI